MTTNSQLLATAFQHHQAGRLQAAEQIYRQVLAVDPAQPDALHLLGVLVHQNGQHESAIQLIGQAVRLRSGVSVFHNNLGEAFRAAGQLPEAIECFQRALALQPNFAEAHNNLGNAHQDQGEFATAVACYHRALAAKPDYAEAHFNLGSTLREQEQFDEAVACLRRALTIDPGLADAQAKLAEVLTELGQLPQAEAAFRLGLRCQPQHVPALAGLAMLLRGNLPTADLALLENRLAGGQLSDHVRADLSFALAHVLDGRSDYGRAAECLRLANAVRLKQFPNRYVPADYEDFVTGLMQTFDAGFFARMASGGLETRQPVFIFGLPRSGTTLIEQILASHSQVHGAGELQFAANAFEGLPKFLNRTGEALDCAGHLDAAELRHLAEQYLARLTAIEQQRAEGDGRIVDKMPENYLHLGLLAAMFPRATFIHCRRDLRDVAVSCWMTNFKMVPWTNASEHIVTRFQQYHRLMEHWRAVLPVPMCEVTYEDTVADLESVARRLVSACGLEWEPACLEFHRTVRPVRTSSARQVRQPVYRNSIGRWKHYELPLAELLSRLPADPAGFS